MGLPVRPGGRAVDPGCDHRPQCGETARGKHRRGFAGGSNGATILRVHDVAATRYALAVLAAMDAHGATEAMSRKYFGTDGVRGRVGEGPITPEFVMRLGFAAGEVLVKAIGQPKGEHPRS